MGLFNFIKKPVVEERAYHGIAISELFYNNNIYINENLVSRIPVVAESVNLICGAVAQLPINVFIEKGIKIDRQYEDYREVLLNAENNNYSTSYNFKYNLVRDLLLYGKSYTYIQRKGSKIVGLHRVEPKTVTIKDYVNDKGLIVDREIHYTLNNKALIANIYDFMVIEKGKGILNSSDLLELIFTYNSTLKAGFEQAAKPLGLLQSKGRLTDTALARIKQSWANIYTGSSNAGKTVILEEGLEYKSLDMNLEQLSMLDTKQSFIDDVQRLFNLFDIKSDDEFLKRTLAPIIGCIESSIDKDLLLEKEKQKGYFTRFDTRELLRPSTESQFAMMKEAISGGIITINEARSYLDYPIFFDDDNDKLLLSLGNCLADKDMNIDVLNLGIQLNTKDKTSVKYRDNDNSSNNTSAENNVADNSIEENLVN